MYTVIRERGGEKLFKVQSSMFRVQCLLIAVTYELYSTGEGLDFGLRNVNFEMRI